MEQLQCLVLTAALLGKELELALLGLVASGYQVLQGLLSALGGLAAHNAAMLVVLHGTAGQTTGGVVGSSMHYLSTGADGLHSTTGHAGSCLAMLAGCLTGCTTSCHFFLPQATIFLRKHAYAIQ